MSDRRRRRRAENAEEPEEVPVRRRRYNTRSAVRDEENDRRSLSERWTEHYWSANGINPNSGVRVLGIPFICRRYARNSTDQNRAGSSSRRQEPERSSRLPRLTGVRSLASSSRSGEASTSSAGTSGVSRSRVTRVVRPRVTRNAAANRSRSARSSETRQDDESRSNQMNGRRIRSYAAMSTGGRALPRSVMESRRRRDGATSSSARTTRIRTGNRVLLRFPAPRALDTVALARPSTSSGSRSNGSLQRQRTSTNSSDRGRTRSDDEFSAVMRSLDLVRTREAQRRRAILRIVDISGDRRRTDLGPPNPPRPSRGSNILRSSTNASQDSSTGSRHRHSILHPPSSGRENSTIDDIIGLPSSSRSAPTRTPTANVRVRRDESNRGSDDLITYNMTSNGSGINIRVAFGTDEDEDSESNDPTFSSGDSDATTFVSSISDAEMSDVFFSDTDRVESDSGESIESASTAASPHSLVSLSLNALHPSPTPSLSSAETDAHEEEEEEAADDDDDDDQPTLERAIITSMRNVGNPIIFLHNNISVQLLSSMAELADAFSNMHQNFRTRLRANPTAGQGDGFRGFTPPRFNMEPARRQVPESVDCQRAKLIDELNSNTAECVICTDLILAEERVWPCNNCFNIFHLHCIRRWAKTNRSTEMGGAWICPVCRRPKFCTPNKLRYKCLCGRLQKPKPTPGVTPHCCGQKCKQKCGLLCHPGPCKMSEEETAAVSKATSSGQGEGDEPDPPGTEQDARTISV
uniref:PHD-type domain-containing protein n=1 Tax=Lygus hesperus TaxID=30085 RepID=A0A0K8TIL1_LYGHE